MDFYECGVFTIVQSSEFIKFYWFDMDAGKVVSEVVSMN